MSNILEVFKDSRSFALVANGAIHDPSFIATLVKSYDRCIAVDGGLVHCHEMHVRPDLLIGDFDSVIPSLLEMYHDIPREQYPPDKNFTDLELAVMKALQNGAEKIAIFGAMELRTDHAIANLHLMRRFAEKVIIETERETLFMVSGNRTLSCFPGQTISLLPLGMPAKGVTTNGLKWELTSATLDTNFVSLSNICIDRSCDISIEEGDLVCCLLRSCSI